VCVCNLKNRQSECGILKNTHMIHVRTFRNNEK